MRDIVYGGDSITDRKRTRIRMVRETVVVLTMLMLADTVLALSKSCGLDYLNLNKEIL